MNDKVSVLPETLEDEVNCFDEDIRPEFLEGVRFEDLLPSDLAQARRSA